MHAYTNSAHPTASAVGLRNLQIFEDEHLVENAAAMGERLGSGDVPGVAQCLLALSEDDQCSCEIVDEGEAVKLVGIAERIAGLPGQGLRK
jgi:hypothetical protein